MKNHIALITVLILSSIVLSPIQSTQAWGFSVHKEITSHAVDILPNPWKNYFKDLKNDLRDASIAPDQRKSIDPKEPARHYDDQDKPHKDKDVKYPSSDWNDGVVSWAVENATKHLISALKANNQTAIIRYMGDIAHYISDATQPLHATKNFDGQLTGNRGIHARFEQDVIEKNFNDAFDLSDFSELRVIDDPYNLTETEIHSGLDNVPQIMAADDLAQNNSDSFNSEYYNILYQELRPLIHDRLQLAIQNTANLWYTAFIKAGWMVSSGQSVTVTTPNPSMTKSTPFPSVLIMTMVFITIIPIKKIRSRIS